MTDDFLLFGSVSRDSNGEVVYDKPSAVVFPLTSEGKVVVLRHFRYPVRGWLFELPGGNDDGNLQRIAKTELGEETGYAADDRSIEYLSCQNYWFDPASSKSRYRPVLARNCVKCRAPLRKPNEFFYPEEIELSEWQRMVIVGEVLDSKSIVTTMLALERLRESHAVL